ncbi:MAG: PDDEXK nuclease domain-containing protein [Streptococcaceae bacterium]|jgi:predicted nuclease of restriction endonuclease-like (RecB) superfamily|nr:PDDEXK nuclease domain-containing protein [Streptococcaceae bacterium]MCH4176810.1 PDDEXK nuclease domain-containing protein [Streptococcaceae bacterium]
MDNIQFDRQPKEIVSDIQYIIDNARNNAIRSVDFERVQMYWKIGERIVVEEQNNQERAEYGKFIVENLSKILLKEYGSGFNKRNLYRAIQFYRTYPKVSALRSQLNWMQYRLLMGIEDNDKRDYYELEAVKNNWTGRELERQINSLFYERLLLSTDKDAMMKIAKEDRLPEKPTEIVKDPMVLEFLGLENRPTYRESDLESAIIEHLEEFLLEFGNGFSFVAKQKRITLEDDEFFIDLVFYNRLLQAHVIIEIKTHKLTHEDLGQLQMYVNYYDRNIKLKHEKPTIGILLCTEKNNTLVKYALPEDNENILSSEYKLIIPSEESLKTEVEKVERELQDDSEVGE